jgi:hypothetical protein
MEVSSHGSNYLKIAFLLAQNLGVLQFGGERIITDRLYQAEWLGDCPSLLDT